MSIDLIIKAETEGLETEEEVVELAKFYIDTGLVNSTGSNQRFVASVVETFPEAFQAPKPKRYHDGCSYCDREYAKNGDKLTMMPSHDASSRCQSGGHNHCTCDTCF